MQDVNWSDLRYLLAVSRKGSFGAAGRQLGVDGTTVARRVRRLEAALGARLLERGEAGVVTLSETGCRAIERAEGVEREIGDLLASVSGGDLDVSGRVVVTAVPSIVNRLLIPAVDRLLSNHPALELDLIGEARNLSLTRREADIALRLARPTEGGMKVKARKIGRLEYQPYVSTTHSDEVMGTQPWITYHDALLDLPHAAWMARRIGHKNEAGCRLRIADMEAAVEAVAAGLGRCLLPRYAAAGNPRVKCASMGATGPSVSRDVWLLVHGDLVGLARIEAVSNWLCQIFARSDL